METGFRGVVYWTVKLSVSTTVLGIGFDLGFRGFRVFGV